MKSPLSRRIVSYGKAKYYYAFGQHESEDCPAGTNTNKPNTPGEALWVF
jgi:hypothetical protein